MQAPGNNRQTWRQEQQHGEGGIPGGTAQQGLFRLGAHRDSGLWNEEIDFLLA